MNHLWSQLVVRESWGLFVFATYSNPADEELFLSPLILQLSAPHFCPPSGTINSAICLSPNAESLKVSKASLASLKTLNTRFRLKPSCFWFDFLCIRGVKHICSSFFSHFSCNRKRTRVPRFVLIQVKALHHKWPTLPVWCFKFCRWHNISNRDAVMESEVVL